MAGTGDAPPSSPPASPPADASGARRSLILTLVAAAVVFGVAAAATVAVRRATTPEGYTDTDRAVFLDACLAGGGEPMRSTCECAWDGIVEAVPAARYHELDAAARTVPLTSVVAGSAVSLPPVVPPELEGIVTLCLARNVLLPAAGDTAPAAGGAGGSEPAGPASSIQSSADDPAPAPGPPPPSAGTAPATLEFRPDTVPPS